MVTEQLNSVWVLDDCGPAKQLAAQLQLPLTEQPPQEGLYLAYGDNGLAIIPAVTTSSIPNAG